MSAGIAPRGRAFVRSLIALACKHPDTEILRRWGAFEGLPVVKAAVAALDKTATGEPSAIEFLGLVREASIVGRLPNARRVPFHVRNTRMVNGTRGFWVGEAKPIPLSKPSITGSVLDQLKVASIVVATRDAMSEALNGGSGLSEANLQDDLLRAASLSLDEAFLDSSNAGVANVRPAAITYGATSIASTGDPAADLKAMIASFQGDLDTASFVTDPLTATQMALARDAGGAFLFPDLGPRGGSVLNIPVLTSRASPYDSNGGQIALIDAAGLATGMDDLEYSVATDASLLMADDPESGSADVVSLFQTNSVAFRLTVLANWERQRTNGVVVVTGVTY